MCGGRAGAAHSCARVFGSRRADRRCCVCMCVRGRAHPAGSAPEGADAASYSRAGRSSAVFVACAYNMYEPDFFQLKLHA